MHELRPEIHEAFANQQSKLGNLADSREWLVRGALAAGAVHHGGRTQFAASIAAVVIAALVIATFAYVRTGVGVTRHGPPVPASSPTPLSRPLNVSNDTPVVLFADPVNEAQVDGITWDGKQKGRVDWPARQATANPSANLFASAAEIRDRSGTVIASGNFGGKFFNGTWADDGQQISSMVPAGLPGPNGVAAILQVVIPGQSAKKRGPGRKDLRASHNQGARVQRSQGPGGCIPEFWKLARRRRTLGRSAIHGEGSVDSHVRPLECQGGRGFAGWRIHIRDQRRPGQPRVRNLWRRRNPPRPAECSCRGVLLGWVARGHE